MLYINFPDWIKPEIIPGLPIRWYGFMYLVAFAITFMLFMWQIKNRKLKIPSDLVVSMFFWAIVGMFIGARIFAATIYDTTGRYLSQPWLIFWPFDAKMNFTGLMGMSYHGGLVGVTAAIIIYLKIKKLDVLDWADMLAQAVPLGYTFGRLGNFINGELFGRVSESPWGIVFPNASRLPTSAVWVRETAERIGMPIEEGVTLVNLPRHPSQLYEAFFEGIVLWLILWFIVRKHKPFKGFAIGIYLIGYAFFRFIIEYFREPDKGLEYVVQLGPKDNPPELLMSLLNFSTGQVLNFIMILAGIAILFVFKYIHDKRPHAETFDAVRTKPQRKSIPNKKSK